MKRYIITIVDIDTNCKSFLEKSENEIDDVVLKELGGWNNLYEATTSGYTASQKAFMQTGTTKQGNKAFSIICLG